MQGALDGGATSTLRLDQTGKGLGHALLRLPVSRPGERAARAPTNDGRARRRSPG